MPMTEEFEPWISGVRSNPSINCDAAIALRLLQNTTTREPTKFVASNLITILFSYY